MNGTRPNCLIDSNLLVYAVDPRDRSKQERALASLAGVRAANLGALSPQILGEFFVVVTRRLPAPLTITEAERMVNDYVRSWIVYDLTAAVVAKAIAGLKRYQFAYWDALIWATAEEHQLAYVLSEDFNAGAVLGDVRFLNPFHPSFDIGLLRPT